MVVLVCNLTYSGRGGVRISSLRPAQVKVAVRSCLENKIKTKEL
jgi:hypothetical protein